MRKSSYNKYAEYIVARSCIIFLWEFFLPCFRKHRPILDLYQEVNMIRHETVCQRFTHGIGVVVITFQKVPVVFW